MPSGSTHSHNRHARGKLISCQMEVDDKGYYGDLTLAGRASQLEGGAVSGIQERYRGYQVIGIDTIRQKSRLQDQWGVYLVRVRVIFTVCQRTVRGVIPKASPPHAEPSQARLPERSLPSGVVVELESTRNLPPTTRPPGHRAATHLRRAATCRTPLPDRLPSPQARRSHTRDADRG